MTTSISILILTFNDICAPLVEQLRKQLMAVDSLAWEIIVADDGSTDQTVVERNRAINQWEGCRMIERKQNCGRAAIRNFLTKQAQYDRLLFIDGDMTIVSDKFISSYLAQTAPVVYGGYKIMISNDTLRCRYEMACAPEHDVERRREQPYHDFHTSNFLINKDVVTNHPFDERFRNYGYEDVFFGKQLREAGVQIEHVDNPTGFCFFETDEDFVRKTEESIVTLYTFSEELEEYSRLLTAAKKTERMHMLRISTWAYNLVGRRMRKCLCKGNASLLTFRIYKLLYLNQYTFRRSPSHN